MKRQATRIHIPYCQLQFPVQKPTDRPNRHYKPDRATPQTLHHEILQNRHNFAFSIYKVLKTYKQLHLLPAEDFSSLLQFSTNHILPQIAVVKSSILITDMLYHKKEPDVRDYNNLMTVRYRNGNDVGQVLQLFDSMVERDVKSWCIVLGSLGKSGDIKQTLSYYTQMTQTHPLYTENMEIQCLLLLAYGYSHTLSKAQEYFHSLHTTLKSKKIPIHLEKEYMNRYISTMIKVYALNNESDKAVELFYQSKKHHCSLHAYESLFFNLSMNGCTRERGLETWKEVWSYCTSTYKESLIIGKEEFIPDQHNGLYLPYLTNPKSSGIFEKMNDDIKASKLKKQLQTTQVYQLNDGIESLDGSSYEFFLDSSFIPFQQANTVDIFSDRVGYPYRNIYIHYLRILVSNLRVQRKTHEELDAQLHEVYVLFWECLSEYGEIEEDGYGLMVWAHLNVGDEKRAREWWEGMKYVGFSMQRDFELWNRMQS